MTRTARAIAVRAMSPIRNRGRRAAFSLVSLLAPAALALGLGAPDGARADDTSYKSGMVAAYFAARHAEAVGDYGEAALRYRIALALAPEDLEVLRPALLYAVLAGDAAHVGGLTERAAAAAPAAEFDPITRMALAADLIKRGRYADAGPVVEAIRVNGNPAIGLTKTLLSGWTAYGAGDAVAAERAFAEGVELNRAELLALFGSYHIGLMKAASGDHAGAVAAFEKSRDAAGAWSARLAFAAAISLGRDGEFDAALARLDEVLARDPQNEQLIRARAVLARGETLPLLAKNPADGVAEAMHSVAAAESPRAARRALLLAQLARRLNPRFEEASLLAASLLDRLEQYTLAADLFATIPSTSPLAESAAIGRATALGADDRPEEALAQLRALADQPEPSPHVFFRMGGLLNDLKRYDACAAAYKDGLDRLPAVTERDWSFMFGQGICLERAKRWPEAEPVFEAILKLQPEQPDVLNYLGYTLVDQGRRLEEALEMIKRAVAARPESGYIVDSLGWALYRLGDYDGAVRELEKAVELAPSEAVIHDHFGDALWKVGRKLEARFQWRRSLSFDPEDLDVPRVKRKLEVGLDVVLEEEAKAGGAPEQAAAEPGSEEEPPARVEPGSNDG